MYVLYYDEINFIICVAKKFYYYWDSWRCDNISDRGRSANRNRNNIQLITILFHW